MKTTKQQFSEVDKNCMAPPPSITVTKQQNAEFRNIYVDLNLLNKSIKNRKTGILLLLTIRSLYRKLHF